MGVPPCTGAETMGAAWQSKSSGFVGSGILAQLEEDPVHMRHCILPFREFFAYLRRHACFERKFLTHLCLSLLLLIAK